ncbi:helix-turn-helix domain-containing protein [Microbacterium sediminicola]|uniref:helix-turn-helix domain-containing protein n=1 Tax=Microbacterium sediminicola TaxID=415210 RepID=UPI003CD0A57D
MTNANALQVAAAPATPHARLRASRTFVNVDQAQMAAMLGYSLRTVSNWERGISEPPLSALAGWARITRRSIDWIAFGDGDEEAPSPDGASNRSHLRESNPRPIHYE